MASLHTRPPDAQLTQGSPLVVDITTPHYESYVNVVVLLITPAPLFEQLRAPSEPRAAYLAAVGPQLKQMEARYGRGRVVADFVQITTHARSE